MKTIKDYSEYIFTIDSYWYMKRKQKGRAIIYKEIDNRNYIVRNFIIPFWGDMQPEQITPKIINEKLITARSRRGVDVTYSTKNKILTCLSDIYKHLIEEEILFDNPVKKVVRFSSQIVNPRGILTPTEIELLFPEDHTQLLKIWKNQMYACAFLILKDTGLRPNELIALQWKDWFSELKFFPVVKAIEAGTRNKIKGTKTGSVKPALVSEFTAREIENLKNSISPRPEDFIFSFSKGLPIGIHTLSRAFQRGVKRTGLDRPEITPYWLRHTFNTRALETLPEDIVRKLMGHSTQQMTRHYRHADVSLLMREAQKIRPIIEQDTPREALSVKPFIRMLTWNKKIS